MVVSVLNGFAIGFLLFVLAVGLSLVFGMMDVLNLAHGALFLGGAYLGAVLSDGWGGFLAALGIAAVGGLLAGGVLSLMTEPLRHRSHLDQALLTLGIALVTAELLIIVFGDDPLSVAAPPGLRRLDERARRGVPDLPAGHHRGRRGAGAGRLARRRAHPGRERWSGRPWPTATWSPRSAWTTGWSRSACSRSVPCWPPWPGCSAGRSTAPAPAWTPPCSSSHSS